MSTYTSEPGTRLAGRYRLEDQTSAGAGWEFWKATDETLARPVTVITFAADFPRVAETVTAARAASRLSDPRFCQVFDVEDADELAYVVLEWAVGESLLDMLSDGPLEASPAAALVAEAARALAVAHAAGLVHLRLDPSCLHWTPGGGVKITGLGIAAALAGPALASGGGPDDAAVADTRGLARLAYAALTGYWPGPAGPGDVLVAGEGLLPSAPLADGLPCTPRQVSAAVPASIDEVICRALFQRPSRHGPALATPAMFAEALARLAPAAPLLVPPPALPFTAAAARTQPGAYPLADSIVPPGSALPRRQPRERSAAARAAVALVIVLVLAAVGITAWSVSRGLHRAAPPSANPRPRSSAPAAAAAVLLKPRSANSFDPGGGSEDPAEAQYAIAGISGRSWHTFYYIGSPLFGGLPKKGTGLILDMGQPVRLSQVMVQFGTTCCAHARIEIGNDSTPVSSALSSFTTVAASTTAAGSTTFTSTSSATGRYVLIWLTYLPPLAGTADEYQAQIYDVVVHGSAVSQSG
ncbi:MAG: protein kinase family protein [Streptosporangiaceae bacterium]|nr:protein kinase family protein [Streptosporangiaceae bacterium]